MYIEQADLFIFSTKLTQKTFISIFIKANVFYFCLDTNRTFGVDIFLARIILSENKTMAFYTHTRKVH